MSQERRLRELLARADRAADPGELFEAVSPRLRRMLGFDSAAWCATDPETALITAPMVTENLNGGSDCFAFWECELLEDNVNAFRDLARAAVPVAGLRASTGDLPARSAQFRKLGRRQGLGDELRIVLRVANRSWGVVSLFRERGRPAFDAADTALAASLSGPLATRLRAFARPVPGRPPADGPGPGLVLFDASGTPLSVNEEARHHLGQLPPGPLAGPVPGLRLPVCVVGTALQARAIAEGRDRGTARVRVRTVDGRWLVCHASRMTGADGAPGPIAVIIEPAPVGDIASIIADAYELTTRELEITQLIARGLATGEIAEALVISPHTVRGHVKTVFQKVGVSSRGALVARLFAEHYWPRRPSPAGPGVAGGAGPSGTGRQD
ncbi:LuxR C-terminal-related transcriptional regulator [Streptomyces sp. NPDC018031]|uniref:LuxR C-terminal-related transcriptional regulator n=1 Tax=Streptomyces sp. NPDC018031 TaxID=3365033 RepID=UPI0037B747D2